MQVQRLRDNGERIMARLEFTVSERCTAGRHIRFKLPV
jgi:hypothetical protein